MPDLLIEAPHLANEVATKYVLLSRDDCPDLCASLKDVPLDTRTHFASALEKNLRRVGRIRKWVECRTALSKLGSDC